MMDDSYGRSLPLPSMRFDLESLSWRTCEATSLWDLEMSSPTFPEWGMTRGGELFELRTPERPTVGPGSSSLPTPTARDYKDVEIGPAKHRPDDEDTLARALHHLIPTSLLKTPVASENGRLDRPERYLNRNEPQGRFDLSDQVAALLPTPTVMDMGSNYTPEEWEAWKLKQKETHSNGNGHGASLTQEALSIGASTQAQFFDGSECSDDQPLIPLSPE